VEVITEEQSQPGRMGGWADEEVFDQGEAVFTQVDGMYACYR
jgi:hypothetical protein